MQRSDPLAWKKTGDARKRYELPDAFRNQLTIQKQILNEQIFIHNQQIFNTRQLIDSYLSGEKNKTSKEDLIQNKIKLLKTAKFTQLFTSKIEPLFYENILTILVDAYLLVYQDGSSVNCQDYIKEIINRMQDVDFINYVIQLPHFYANYFSYIENMISLRRFGRFQFPADDRYLNNNLSVLKGLFQARYFYLNLFLKAIQNFDQTVELKIKLINETRFIEDMFLIPNVNPSLYPDLAKVLIDIYLLDFQAGQPMGQLFRYAQFCVGIRDLNFLRFVLSYNANPFIAEFIKRHRIENPLCLAERINHNFYGFINDILGFKDKAHNKYANNFTKITVLAEEPISSYAQGPFALTNFIELNSGGTTSTQETQDVEPLNTDPKYLAGTTEGTQETQGEEEKFPDFNGGLTPDDLKLMQSTLEGTSAETLPTTEPSPQTESGSLAYRRR